MAEPDCGFCRAVGLRACDECGQPCERDSFGLELCDRCRAGSLILGA